MLDSRAPNDPQIHSSAGTAPQAEQKVLSVQSSSSSSSHVRPNDAGAERHQSQIHFHQDQSYAGNENQPISNHHGSNLNSAPQAKGFHRNHSRKRSSSQADDAKRFSPYFNPQGIDCLPKLSTSLNPSNDQFIKPRKRTIFLKPKYPKYEGLSNFAAPRDLVSDMIPGSHTVNPEKFIPAASKTVSRLTPDEMSPKQLANSKTITDFQSHESSLVPIDFLKRLNFQEWDQRMRDLSQMVEDRKKLFLRNGFAETSGKPFLADEQIQRKPIPNRWVWYMHLSTDYDKAKSTRVPAGGPAGYLKYGWDRLGVAGKQPYQELADIYSAQRVKFMAEHGIKEDTTKRKPKQSDKPKARKRRSQENIAATRRDKDQKNHHLVNESPSPLAGTIESFDRGICGHLSNFHANAPLMSLPSILQPSLFYEPANRFLMEKPPCDYVDGNSDMLEMNEAPPYSSYLQSPDLMPSSFSPLGYEPASYGHRYHSEPNADQLNTPIGYPSSPTEYPFACNPGSTFPYPAASEFQTWSTLSPESINSGRSETVGVFPQPCMDNTFPSSANYTSLAPSNTFLENFNRHEIDLNALHPSSVL